MQEYSTSATRTFLDVAMVLNTLQGTVRNPKYPKGHVKHAGKQHSVPLALLELARARGTLRGILTNRKDPGNIAKRAGKQHFADTT
mgnify:CR=1 FL=1